MSMVALDLETTGLDMRQDKIIEIGMIRFDGAKILETYQTFINPDRPIPSAVSQLTHILGGVCGLVIGSFLYRGPRRRRRS